jgi:SAM-dependent methyltransferase
METAATPVADATRIMQLSTAYWDSQILLTANRVGLFGVIGEGEQTGPAIAAALGFAARPTALLLKSLVSLGLLQEQAGRFSNTPAGKALLVPGGASFMGNSFRYSDDLYNTWGLLEQALRDDAPQLPPAQYLGDDAERTRHFVYAMHDRALGTASTLVDLVDLTGRHTMLDVGGGPGTYSALFCRRYAQLSSQVLDLPGVTAIAAEIVADMQVADRVGFIAGDYFTRDWPADRDVVMISGVFHRETAAACQQLIARAHASLAPGGLLVIADVMTDSTGSAPTMAALFGLNMLLTAADGGVHADADIASWMAAAGLEQLETQIFPPPMPHRVVTGVKS